MSTRANLPLIVRDLGCRDYVTVWQAMLEFTQHRDDTTDDEIWLVEHPAVFTLGYNADPSHILNANAINVVKTDRGGQVTYHGPGQLVMYPLLDLNRNKLGVKSLVQQLENTVINYLATLNITASHRPDAPGVYVADEKIAALGLRIRRGKSYHGLSFNIDMDLSPFSQINPCGFQDLKVTQLSQLLAPQPCPTINAIKRDILPHFCQQLGYNAIIND